MAFLAFLYWTFAQLLYAFNPLLAEVACAMASGWRVDFRRRLQWPIPFRQRSRIRQTVKLRARNRARKELIKIEMKAFAAAVATGDAATSEAALSKVASRLDKVASKGTLHKNTAARKRSRLAKRVNALRKQSAGAGTSAVKA